MSKYKKDEKVLISVEMYMNCWIPREMYEEIRDAAYDGDGDYDRIELGKAETRYVFNHGWLSGEGYITSDEIKDIEDANTSDWEKYEVDEEKHLNIPEQRGLRNLRNIVGPEDRIRVGNQGNFSDYVIFVDEDLYSNSLTEEEAESEIRCLLTGIRLGERKK